MGAVYLRKNLEVSAPLAIWLVLFEFCIGLGRGQVLTGVGIIINHYQSLAVDFYIFSNIFNFEIYGLFLRFWLSPVNPPWLDLIEFILIAGPAVLVTSLYLILSFSLLESFVERLLGPLFVVIYFLLRF